MIFHHLKHTGLALSLSLFGVSMAGAEEVQSISLMSPGQTIVAEGGSAPSPDKLLSDAWYSANIDGADLVVARISKTRSSDWLIAQGKAEADPAAFKSDSYKSEGQALDAPDGELFAFRLLDTKAHVLELKPGHYPSLIQGPQVLHQGWKANVNFHGGAWVISTRYQNRPTGGLLAGSMELLYTDAKGETTVVLPQAEGMAFVRQEIVWLGDLHGGAAPDVIIKRTWITGEMDYLLATATAFGSTYIDPDHAYSSFSSGAGDSLSVTKYVGQHTALPGHKFGVAAFSLSEENWNKAFDIAATGGMALMAERQLTFEGEAIRFTFEYLPRATPVDASSIAGVFWGGPVVVRVHFRGKSQVIMQAGKLDGTAFGIQIDKIEGQPAIRVEYQPHYNNFFTRYWVWSAEENGKFLRLATIQNQGC